MQDADIRRAARAAAADTARQPVNDTEALISSGLIDSLAVLSLIRRLETDLDISIPVDQVQPDDFDSVELIVETIKRVVK
jgi:acyl carrier protein